MLSTSAFFFGGTVVPALPIEVLGTTGASNNTSVGVEATAVDGDLAVFFASDNGPAISWIGGTGGTPTESGAGFDGTAASLKAASKIVTANTATGVVNQSCVRLKSVVFRNATGLYDVSYTTGTGASVGIPAKTITNPGDYVIAAVVRASSVAPTSGPSGFSNMWTYNQDTGLGTGGYYLGPVSSFAGATITYASGSIEWGLYSAVVSAEPGGGGGGGGGGDAPEGTLYPNSVAQNDDASGYILNTDPSAFVSTSYVGFVGREVPGFNPITQNCHVFLATFTDSPSMEMYMAANPLDGSTYSSQSAAQVDVNKYTGPLGRLPRVYRRNIHHMIGYAGNGVDSSNENLTSEDAGHFFMIYADRANTRIAAGKLNASFLHEGTHASIQEGGILDDYDVLADPAWIAAVSADNDYITDYAATDEQENLAENALFAYVLTFNPTRIPEPDRSWILAKIPNQIAYLQNIFNP